MSFCENTSEEAKRKDALRLLARSVRAQCARQSGQIGRHERLCVQLRPLLASRALQGKAVAGYMAVRGGVSCTGFSPLGNPETRVKTRVEPGFPAYPGFHQG
mgnify:CR=1 FL=1